MKPLSFLLSAALWLASPCAAQDGKALLTEIMNKPGDWDQMCGFPPPVAFAPPLPVYAESLVRRTFGLGPKEAERLQAARAAVVPAMVELLKAMDLTKAPKEMRGPKLGFPGMIAGLRPDWLNAVHLEIISELNAVETLPELLRLEDQLQGLLAAAEKDAKAPLPPLDLDSPVAFLKPGESDNQKRPDKYWESSEYKRDRAIFTSRVLQREILGTITLLLQREQWPAVKERFAAEHKKALEKALADARKDLADAKTESARPSDDDALTILRSESIPWFEKKVKELEAGTAVVPLKVEYSAALRTEIRTMTETFLKSVPPEKRRAAAAMPKHEPSK